MAALLLPLLGWLGRGLTSVFGSGILMHLAFKAILIAIFTIVLPVVLSKLLYGGAPVLIDHMLSYLGAHEIGSASLNLTGVAGWLATKLRLVECISLLISAVVGRITFSFAKKAVFTSLSAGV